MPATSTLNDVRRIAPELSPVSDTDIEAFIEDARLEFNRERWGRLYDRAVALLAAHLASLANVEFAAGAGPITSESAGSVSRGYAGMTGAASAGLWGTTRFGVELERLLRLLGPAVRVI